MHLRKNREIIAREVRVIGPDGKQYGVLALEEALSMARGFRMDLVEVAPNATPPVARIVDYEKYEEEIRKRKTPPNYTDN